MIRYGNHASACLALVIGFYAGGLSASASRLDQAVKKYYAGYPSEAIAMIKPSAIEGNVDAQYLLGNILYSLSQSKQTQDDPLQWYHLAAEQNSAPANYALGTIYQNRWLQMHRKADADLAQLHYQQALNLGDPKAQVALTNLATQRKTASKPNSLTYTNDSFRAKKSPPQKPESIAQKMPQSIPKREALNQALASFQSSGDLLADARKLQQLLSQMQGIDPATGTEQATSNTPALGALTQMLSGFESTDGLLADLVKLYDHIKTATEFSTAPGAN